MSTQEAINIFAQVEQKFVCDGASHDVLKEACLAGLAVTGTGSFTGNVGIGTTTFGTSAAKAIGIGNA